MVKRKMLMAVIVIGMFAYSSADDLPFGSYDFDSQMSSSALAEFRDSLGFNIFVDEGFLNCDTVNLAFNEEIFPVNLYQDTVSKYTKFAYAQVQPEETNSQMRLYQIGGQTVGGYWVSSGSGNVLFGPNGYIPGYSTGPQYYIKFQRKNPLDREVINYTAALRLKIDEVGTVTDTVLSVDLICMIWGCEADTAYFLRTITAGQFPGDNLDTTLFIQFSLPESILVDCPNEGRVKKDGSGPGTAIKLTSTGQRTVSVDWIKVYEDEGRNLVDLHIYDDVIAADARRYADCDDAFWGWYTNDEPFPLTMKSAGYVLDVVRDSVDTQGKWNFITANNALHANHYWLEVVNTSLIANDYYPYVCNCSYTGYSTDSQTMYNTIQGQLNNCTMNWWKSYHLAAENRSRQFWVFPQAFDGRDYGCWRRPTDSEFRCQTYLALASDVDGIIYWKYDYSIYSDTSGWYNQGLRDTTGEKTSLWYVVKEELNPYIKAIDDIYAGLVWDTSYVVNYQYGFKPENVNGSWIDTIYATSNSTESNPDLGWFHVGQFTAGDSHYFMLVNRACSKNEDGDSAPSITATVKFNPAALGLGNYVYIIDIADSIFFTAVEPDSVWPDTTYSAALSGVIPFTMVLGPGEGRLFKIVGTSSNRLTFYDSGLDLGQGY